MNRLADYLPILDWGRRYSRATLTNDMVAAIIVTIMLIPQSLAYAMLAGLPAEIGLYASMLPLVPTQCLAPAGHWRSVLSQWSR